MKINIPNIACKSRRSFFGGSSKITDTFVYPLLLRRAMSNDAQKVFQKGGLTRLRLRHLTVQLRIGYSHE
jgi:hypothetical protein